VPDIHDTDALPAAPASAAGQPSAAPAVGGEGYRVRAGDSLWSIATRLLGEAASPAQIDAMVDRLWRVNADRIATGDPDLIRPGTVLVLPREA